MHLIDHFGVRLRTERERLGFSQQEAAIVGRVRREMWGKYERGEAEPGVNVIEYFCAHGADAQFLISGVRSAADGVELQVLASTRAFHGRLLEAIAAKDLHTVARQCRLTEVELQDILAGKNFPRLDHAYALAGALGVKPAWLFAGA